MSGSLQLTAPDPDTGHSLGSGWSVACARFAGGVDSFERRICGLEERVYGLEARVYGLEARVHELEASQVSQQVQTENIGKVVSRWPSQMLQLQTTESSMKSQIQALGPRIDDVVGKMGELVQKVDEAVTSALRRTPAPKGEAAKVEALQEQVADLNLSLQTAIERLGVLEVREVSAPKGGGAEVKTLWAKVADLNLSLQTANERLAVLEAREVPAPKGGGAEVKTVQAKVDQWQQQMTTRVANNRQEAKDIGTALNTRLNKHEATMKRKCDELERRLIKGIGVNQASQTSSEASTEPPAPNRVQKTPPRGPPEVSCSPPPNEIPTIRQKGLVYHPCIGGGAGQSTLQVVADIFGHADDEALLKSLDASVALLQWLRALPSTERLSEGMTAASTALDSLTRCLISFVSSQSISNEFSLRVCGRKDHKPIVMQERALWEQIQHALLTQFNRSSDLPVDLASALRPHLQEQLSKWCYYVFTSTSKPGKPDRFLLVEHSSEMGREIVDHWEKRPQATQGAVVFLGARSAEGTA